MEHWTHLYAKLREIKERGTKIIYVPGNHDPYVFLFEAVGQFPWAYEVLKRCPQLHEMYAQTSSHRLGALIEIACPIVRLPSAGKQLLLTHGHAEDWFWRLIDPNQEGVRIDMHPGMLEFLTHAATSFAHKYFSDFAGKHLRTLRHAVNAKEQFLKWVQHRLDVGLVITNRVINAHRQGLNDYQASPGAFCDVLEAAFQAYVQSTVDGDSKAIDDDVQRSLQRLEKIYAEPLDAIHRDTKQYLEQSSALNYSIGPSNDRGVAHSSERVHGFLDFHTLIVGHFHKPREQSPTYDSGCFYEGISSGFQINQDGSILRPDW